MDAETESRGTLEHRWWRESIDDEGSCSLVCGAVDRAVVDEPQNAELGSIRPEEDEPRGVAFGGEGDDERVGAVRVGAGIDRDRARHHERRGDRDAGRAGGFGEHLGGGDGDADGGVAAGADGDADA